MLIFMKLLFLIANCGVWMNANNVNNRVADGVVALTQGSNYQQMPYKPNFC